MNHKPSFFGLRKPASYGALVLSSLVKNQIHCGFAGQEEAIVVSCHFKFILFDFH